MVSERVLPLVWSSRFWQLTIRRSPIRWLPIRWFQIQRLSLVSSALLVSALLIGALGVHGLISPVPARAHTGLRSSTPAAGAELHELPGELRLTFTEPITLTLTRLELIGPDGESVPLTQPIQHPDSPQVVIVTISGALVEGAYQVTWRTAGRDGHPVAGDFEFAIAASAFGALSTEDETTGGTAGDPVREELAVDPGVAPRGEGGVAGDPDAATSSGGPPAPGFGVGSPLYILIRLLGFVGVLGLVGVVSFHFLLLPRIAEVGEGAGRRLAALIGSTPARLGAILSVVLGLAVVLRAIAQGYALGNGRFDSEGLRAILSGTLWGWGWLVQLLGVLGAGVGFRMVNRGRQGGWALAGVAVLLLGGTLGLSGHAAGISSGLSIALLADAIHLLGARPHLRGGRDRDRGDRCLVPSGRPP